MRRSGRRPAMLGIFTLYPPSSSSALVAGRCTQYGASTAGIKYVQVYFVFDGDCNKDSFGVLNPQTTRGAPT
jgi:hypothetical protein